MKGMPYLSWHGVYGRDRKPARYVFYRGSSRLRRSSFCFSHRKNNRFFFSEISEAKPPETQQFRNHMGCFSSLPNRSVRYVNISYARVLGSLRLCNGRKPRGQWATRCSGSKTETRPQRGSCTDDTQNSFLTLLALHCAKIYIWL